MAVIRFVLGRIILFLNWLFSPRSIQRDAQAQALVDAQTAGLKLYHYAACPFCVKVRRAMKRQALDIETRDVKRASDAKEELLAGGGVLKVPCLRIEQASGEVRWMYESTDIVTYLERRFAPGAEAQAEGTGV